MNSTTNNQLHGEILHALAEFKVLTRPAYCNKVKLFKEYFKNPLHQNAFRSPEYIKELSYLVDESNLKKACYYEVIAFYHLLDKDRNKIIPEAQLLYDALARKVKMKPQTSIVATLFPFIALPAIIYAFRYSLRGGKSYTAIVVFFLFICACFWIYKKLHNRYSHVVAQIFTLLFTNVVLLFTYALNVWAPIIKNPDSMLNIVVYTFLFSSGWIIGLIIFSFIRLIMKAIKK